MHLLFTYLFTILTLYFIHRNYKKFIRARQLFSLELVHSIAARTVMVTNLPPQLRSERAIAEYFEGMNMSVESVSVCREVDSLKRLLDKRTEALLKLESAWVDYLGNPSRGAPVDSVTGPLVDIENNIPEDQRNKLVVPNRKRPTLRPGWLKAKVDALEYLEDQFREADARVLNRRRTGKFKATHSAFVTFEKMSSAVSTPLPSVITSLTSSYVANCCANRALNQPCTDNHASGSRASRYHLGEHDHQPRRGVRARVGRPRRDGPPPVLLDSPRRCTGWIAELQGDQEDLARSCTSHRRERADWRYRAELAALCCGHLSERMSTVPARR